MGECDICAQELADSPLAAPAHARKHRNQFERLVGRPPDDYDEVRALLRDGDPPDDYDGDVGTVATLDDYLDPDPENAP